MYHSFLVIYKFEEAGQIGIPYIGLTSYFEVEQNHAPNYAVFVPTHCLASSAYILTIQLFLFIWVYEKR